MEDPFNRTSGYGGASISVDNRSLFLAVKTPVPGHPENIDLFSARYALLEDTGDETVYLWSEPQASGRLEYTRRVGIPARRESRWAVALFCSGASGNHHRCARQSHHRHSGEPPSTRWALGRSIRIARPHQQLISATRRPTCTPMDTPCILRPTGRRVAEAMTFGSAGWTVQLCPPIPMAGRDLST